MGSIYLIGSGASTGTLGDEVAPLCRGFGKTLNLLRPSWRKDFPQLFKCIRAFQGVLPDVKPLEWSLDAVWNAIDNHYKLRHILSSRSGLSPEDLVVAGFQLGQAITYVYGDVARPYIEKAGERAGVLSEELSETHGGSCIVSFNYDCLVESLLKKIEIRFVQPELDTVLKQGDLPLLKPHGSLAWRRELWGPGRDEIAIQPDFLREADLRMGISPPPDSKPEIQPGIIAPVIFKDAVLWNHGEKLTLILQNHWTRLMDYLLNTREIVIMGYAFPPEDSYAHSIFQHALAWRRKLALIESRKMLLVRIFEKDEAGFERSRDLLHQRFFFNEEVEFKFEGCVW